MIMKQLKKFFAVAISGPIVGVSYLLSKHWLINTLVGVALASSLPFAMPITVPLFAASFLTGFALSAAGIGLFQQITSFIYNTSINQCEMMVAPMVPEISYAAYKGILFVNQQIAQIDEFEKDRENYEAFYGRKAADALLFTAGHFSCVGRCIPVTWEMKVKFEESSCFSI